MRTEPIPRSLVVLLVNCTLAVGVADRAHAQGRVSPFATRVLEYDPAPGQFVHDPQFNDPRRALGAPIGGGTNHGDLTKLVTLGGFGGTITLGFDRTIRDRPHNRFGLDAIIYGNSFWVGGDPNRRWVEAGVIEISLDVNRNGVPDDPWYLIPGSDIVDPHGQRQEGNYILPDVPFARPPVVNPNVNGIEAYWGYANMGPTLLLGDLDGDNVVDDPTMSPERFYTCPDDPWTVGVSPLSGGGDAFDIAWAIDPKTGAPANLPGFDFIRITTAVDAENFPFGEVSTEIGAVAAVMPRIIRLGELNRRLPINRERLRRFGESYGSIDGDDHYDPAADLNGDGRIDTIDHALLFQVLEE